MDKPYVLRYLPIFYDDLSRTVTYISKVLNNQPAAIKLIDSIETAIVERLPMADRFAKYVSSKERKHPYYYIHVNNYVIYYVVIETGDKKIMEVRRLLHSMQNRNSII